MTHCHAQRVSGSKRTKPEAHGIVREGSLHLTVAYSGQYVSMDIFMYVYVHTQISCVMKLNDRARPCRI